MILITSGAYVDNEFRIEFGLLPPSFLPVGNRRLFEHQIDILSAKFPGEKICISIPESYVINPKDLNYFNDRSISIIKVNENLTLPISVATIIKKLDFLHTGIRILHGDTLLNPVSQSYDVIAVATTREDYLWEIEEADLTSELVWCGYFAFSDVQVLYQCLIEPDVSFAQAIKKYSYQKKIERVLIDSWSDFGHINTYFQNRTKITTERSFNSLQIKHGCVYKTGDNAAKIRAELQWFKSVPSLIKIFCPQLVDFGSNNSGQPYYAIEYLYAPPLNEIYVHGTNPVFYWHKVFKLCAEFLEICRSFSIDQKIADDVKLSFNYLLGEKTVSRLDDFFFKMDGLTWDTELSINGFAVPSVREIVCECISLASRIPVIPGISHGDFCLSNILFDSRSDRIKVLDPRGLDGLSQESSYGNLAYDVAKLNHSIIGLYDHIISGAYSLKVDFSEDKFNAQFDVFTDERILNIQKIFSEKKFIGQIRPYDVMPLTVLLFFSMLPMHDDNENRQFALFANALRLYKNFSEQSRSYI